MIKDLQPPHRLNTLRLGELVAASNRYVFHYSALSSMRSPLAMGPVNANVRAIKFSPDLMIERYWTSDTDLSETFAIYRELDSASRSKTLAADQRPE